MTKEISKIGQSNLVIKGSVAPCKGQTSKKNAVLLKMSSYRACMQSIHSKAIEITQSVTSFFPHSSWRFVNRKSKQWSFYRHLRRNSGE